MEQQTNRRTINQPLTEVYESESGHIVIKQESLVDEDQLIIIDPLFVPKLIEWLQELVDVIQNDTE